MNGARAVATALAAMTCLAAPAAPRWRLQFQYDELETALVLVDLKFPSARRGVAVGTLDGKGRSKPVALVTSDGGEHWSQVPLKERPLSIFFLNDTLGWMVTEKGIWRTEESGRSWKKLMPLADILRVHFLDEKRGCAIGSRKSVLQTADGGATWKRIPALEKLTTTAEYTTFAAVDFAAGRYGIIAGWSRPPRRRTSHVPDWMDPEEAQLRRERPTLTILLETKDGGLSWQPQVTSMFGQITQVRTSPDGRGLGLVEFIESFLWPSDVFQIDLRTGKSSRVYRERDRAVTDILLIPQGAAYLAAVDSAGKLRRSPIPGKLRVLRSSDLAAWSEMPVDYRATATRAVLAAADADHIWVATDTGMILKMVTD